MDSMSIWSFWKLYNWFQNFENIGDAHAKAILKSLKHDFGQSGCSAVLQNDSKAISWSTCELIGWHTFSWKRKPLLAFWRNGSEADCKPKSFYIINLVEYILRPNFLFWRSIKCRVSTNKRYSTREPTLHILVQCVVYDTGYWILDAKIVLLLVFLQTELKIFLKLTKVLIEKISNEVVQQLNHNADNGLPYKDFEKESLSIKVYTDAFFVPRDTHSLTSLLYFPEWQNSNWSVSILDGV